MITVILSKALICVGLNCFPILYGKDTPVGEFQIHVAETDRRGYGGDVIVFKEDSHLWAIHRVWLGSPKQRRLERLDSKDLGDNIITDGCINVHPEVYEYLKSCCSDDKLEIIP